MVVSSYNEKHQEKMEKAYLTVYLKGYDAYVQHGNKARNPYLRMSWARNEWGNGFQDAKRGISRPK